MQIIRETSNGRYIIRAHEPGRVTINDRTYTRNLIVTPQHLDPAWAAQSIDNLKFEHLEPIAGLEPEIVLLGSGSRLQFPGPAIMAWFPERGVGLEVMDTAAACRTYNVLMSEGRNVAAALIML